MSYKSDIQRVVGIIQATKFPSFPGGSNDVKVGDQLPEHAIMAIAENLLKNGIHFETGDKPSVVHAHWICTYNPNMGETEVVCSHCGDRKDVNGCYVTTQGKSCYFEEWYCPVCGATMDEPVD